MMSETEIKVETEHEIEAASSSLIKTPELEPDVQVLLEKMGIKIYEPVGCDHDKNCMCKLLETYFESMNKK